MEGRAERTSLVAAGRWAFPRSSAVVAALSCVALISAGGSWVLHVQGRGEVGAALLAQAQYGDGGLSQGQGQGMVAGGSGGPVYPGEMLSINVPATQLAHSSIGEEVKGSVPAAGGGKVDFTGKIAEGTSLCSGCPVGAVTVRVISDKYVAPGTTVEGLVAGKPFTGTVTDAASDNQRLSGMEQRLSTLEGPHKKQIQDLAHELAGFESRLSKLEGHKSIKERIRDLQDRLDHLKYHTTGLDVNLIKENPQGFHFHGNIGPNVLTPHLDDLENGITQIEQAPGPDEAVEPVKHRLNDIERKIEELGGVSGPRHEVAKLEKRIVQLEKKAADP